MAEQYYGTSTAATAGIMQAAERSSGRPTDLASIGSRPIKTPKTWYEDAKHVSALPPNRMHQQQNST
jgi:hypothetical protein